MARHVVLLRAVNVGGRNKVPMAALRALIEGAGGHDVVTLLQSGNAVFKAASAGAAFTRRLEAALAESLGVEADCITRSAAEWGRAIAANPFRAEAAREPACVVMLALTAAPAAKAVAALAAAIPGRERVAAHGAQLYAYYPDGQGRSKLTLPAIERKLGVRGTARNWNTILKLAALLDG